MKSQNSVQTVSFLITLVLIVGACAFGVRMINASQEPVPLEGVEGRLLFYYEGNIFEIPSGSMAEKAADLRIAGPGIHQQYIGFWPEKKVITYRTEDGLQLLDLETREVKTAPTGPTYCASWSPDLTYVNYVMADAGSGKLYLYEVASGNSSLVYEAPVATYSDGRTHSGGVTCGIWIGSDRFIFDRQVGMPSQLTVINGVAEGVGTNTTTLAILGEPLILVDSAEQLFIHAISDDRRHLLFGQGDRMSAKLYHAVLPATFDDFESLQPRFIQSDFYYNNLTVVDNEIVYEGAEYRVRFMNLETFEERVGPMLSGSWIWLESPKDNLIAYVTYEDEVGSIWIANVETDARTLIVDDTLLKDMENLVQEEGLSYYGSHLIGWLPSK